MNNLIVANIALQIIDNGSINQIDASFEKCGSAEVIDVLNIILLTHKERYLRCYNDDLKRSEERALVKDFHILFASSIISDELLLLMFALSVCNDFMSSRFREICSDLLEQVRQCTLQEIKYAVYRKLINIIIGCQLYTTEPYISILREATNCLSLILDNIKGVSELKLLE